METSPWSTEFIVILTTLLGALVLGCTILYGTSKVPKGEDSSVGLIREEIGTFRNQQINDAKKNRSDGGHDEGAITQPVLNPAEFRPFKLLESREVSYNTKLLRFEIPSGQTLRLPIGRHLTVRATIDGSVVNRAYTPTSTPTAKGHFDLLVKAYEFGKMSSYLHSLRPGQPLLVRGPIGRFKYEKNRVKCFGFIAGGTGLTPCLQVIRSVLEEEDEEEKKKEEEEEEDEEKKETASRSNNPPGSQDKTRFVLLYQNRIVEDILLREVLVELESRHPDRLKVLYFLSNPPSAGDREGEWGQRAGEVRGPVDGTAVDRYLTPQLCDQVCVCGPSGFNEAKKKLLHHAGHTDEHIYIW